MTSSVLVIGWLIANMGEGLRTCSRLQAQRVIEQLAQIEPLRLERGERMEASS